MNAILGIKGSMDQAFVEGKRIPVTHIQAGPCVVSGIRKQDKDGYWAVQISLGKKKREVRLNAETEMSVGDKVNASDIFNSGDVVSVVGISKGKGFAGVVKRWRFAGGPKTHGQSDRQRAPGSIGQGTTPGRVFKGKKMAGRMGSERTTVKNLRVVSVEAETGKMDIAGAVPGRRGSLLIIKK